MLKLTYTNLEFQNIPGEDPRTPLFKRRGEKGKGGKGNRRREGKDREGRGGTGEGRKEGGEDMALDMGSAP